MDVLGFFMLHCVDDGQEVSMLVIRQLLFQVRIFLPPPAVKLSLNRSFVHRKENVPQELLGRVVGHIGLLLISS